MTWIIANTIEKIVRGRIQNTVSGKVTMISVVVATSTTIVVAVVVSASTMTTLISFPVAVVAVSFPIAIVSRLTPRRARGVAAVAVTPPPLGVEAAAKA